MGSDTCASPIGVLEIVVATTGMAGERGGGVGRGGGRGCSTGKTLARPARG